jgi:hypothetical protein
MNAKVSAVVALLFVLAPIGASAQASASCPVGLPVTLGIASELSSTVPSASIGFHALMQNQSAALIHDAVLAVAVIQKGTGVVVDRFFVPQRVALLPQSAAKIDFVWKVPTGLSSGTYTVVVTLTPRDATLPEVYSQTLQPVATQDIAVIDGAAPSASVLSVTVNGGPYQSHTAVRISAGTSQVIAATINSTQAPYKGMLTWRLYGADATSTSNALDTQIQDVGLHPGMSSDVRYVLSDTSRDGYLLEGELSDGHTTRYIDVWLERTNGVFPFLDCLNGGTAPALFSGDTALVIGVVLALFLLALAWRALERRVPQGL